jgi:hypothetical protein
LQPASSKITAFILQVFNSLDKAQVTHGHNQVDGVEVFFAVKASGQIGIGVGGRMEVATPGAAKAEPFTSAVQFHVEQSGDDFVDGDLIADHFQKI